MGHCAVGAFDFDVMTREPSRVRASNGRWTDGFSLLELDGRRGGQLATVLIGRPSLFFSCLRMHAGSSLELSYSKPSLTPRALLLQS